MKNFFKRVVATVLRLLATVFGFIIFLAIGYFVIKGILLYNIEKPKLKDNSVLHIALKGKLVERTLEVRLPLKPFEDRQLELISLLEIKKAIQKAQEDDKIEGIYLELRELQGGWASLEEIREALIDFKEEGKFIVAYGELYNQKAYYLASLADKIILHPEGAFFFSGLSKKVVFYKSLFQKLDAEPLIFRAGEYKSAVEPFSRKDMSQESREQDSLLLFSIYDHFISEIAAARKIEGIFLKKIADSLLIRTPQDAYNYQLVDKVGYFDEVESIMKDKLDLDEDEVINYVPFKKYTAYLRHKTPQSTKDNIAVLVAEGDIVNGRGRPYSIGAKYFAESIRRIREDEKIKAVVVRINSPGGYALASDIIWRELVLTKAKKPLVASMSDVAASGGYYVAMACDRIVAQPTTVTGSIGVFGLWVDAGKLLEEKLGITTDVIKTAKSADIFHLGWPLGLNTGRPLTAYEKKFMQETIEKVYDRFLEKVAEGRDLTKASVARIASGRVWTGTLAKENGLVDKLGSLDDAIKMAAEAADLDDDEYTVAYWPKQEITFEEILGDWTGLVKEKIVRHSLGETYPHLESMKKLVNMTGVQARLPYAVEIE